MKILIPLLGSLCVAAVQAATPNELMQGYATEAARAQTGFQANAARGAAFYARAFGISAKLAACATCHTDQPAQGGRHAVTNKPIKPLAPAANAERFTDPAKVEKWFKRNCNEVLGRACTAQEKGDWLTYVQSR